MKQKILCIALIVSAVCLFQPSSYAAGNPKREFRATWLTTHYRIDWPTTVASSSSSSQIAAQKKQLCAILDTLRAGNLNATMLQVRPTADAFYQSSYEPWSHNLTGTRGQDPGYDPLAYAVEEAHKRGLEMHAWVNPFRYEVTAGSYGNADIRAEHPDWIISYSNGSYNGTILDPGIPEVRQYVTNVIMEMVNNYDIDGMIWDDYFYPYGGTTTEDAASKALYKPAGMSDGDWRRENVNKTIKMIYDSIQVVKPWVRFGMAPFGIWTTQKSVASSYGISLPSGITGLDDYSVQFCDPVAWVKGGYVDYIAPQIYWPTTSSGQNYNKLATWWGQSVCKHFSDLLPNGKQVHFFSANNDYSDWVTANEMALEVAANRTAAPDNAPGAIFYNTANYKSKGLVNALAKTCFAGRALPPAMAWKEAPAYSAPSNLQLSGTTLSWSSTAPRFAVYVYDKGTDAQVETSGEALYQICYEKQIDLKRFGDLSKKTVAVSVFDRFGNEGSPIYYNRAANEWRDTIDVHVTGLSLRLTSHSMPVDHIIQLKPTISPSNASVKTLIWTSSDENVVEVDSTGLVTGVGCGTATVTATTVDGGYQVSCVFTITGCTDVEEVEREKTSYLIREGNNLYVLRIAEGKAELYTLTGQRVE